MAKLSFSETRAEEVLLSLHQAYMEKRFIYSRVRSELAPQNVVIPEGVERSSLSHLRFLFPTTIVTYSGDSDAVFRQMKQAFEIAPHLFDERIFGASLSRVVQELYRVGFVHPNQGGGYWHGSLGTLFREYDGDVLALANVASVEEFLVKKAALRKRYKKDALPGIGPKIFSLLALFLEELDLIKEMPGAIPVDLHLQRICISTGIVEGRGLVDATFLAEFLRPRLYEVCRKYRMRPLNAAHALWFLGRLSCTRCSFVQGIEHVCPVVGMCGGATPSSLYSKKGGWNLDAPRLQKGARQSSLHEVILDAAQYGRRTKLPKKASIAKDASATFFQKNQQLSLFGDQ